MPILENERYELFAQSLAQGKTAQQAYSDAGYKPSRKNAWRLKTNKDIAARVLELRVAASKSAEVSIASLIEELEAARVKATSLNQLSAAVRATAEKAKISGLLVEKQQIEVVNTEYEPTSSVEVLAEVMEKVGEQAARALAAAFGLEFDEAAIRALYDGPNVPIRAPGYSQRRGRACDGDSQIAQSETFARRERFSPRGRARKRPLKRAALSLEE